MMRRTKMITRITKSGHIEIKEVTEAGIHRYVLSPGDDLTGQPKEVVDAAKERWTPEVVADYKASIAAQMLPPPTPEQIAEQEKKVLIQAKMREMAEAELIAEGKLTEK
jgi:hypothetical protein